MIPMFIISEEVWHSRKYMVFLKNYQQQLRINQKNMVVGLSTQDGKKNVQNDPKQSDIVLKIHHHITRAQKQRPGKGWTIAGHSRKLSERPVLQGTLHYVTLIMILRRMKPLNPWLTKCYKIIRNPPKILMGADGTLYGKSIYFPTDAS